MQVLISDFISWQYFILVLLIVLFIIWLFWGGQKDLEFIGLAPLKIGVDANTNAEHVNSEDESEEEEEPVDNTPTLPNLEDRKKLAPFTNFREGEYLPSISLSESVDFFEGTTILDLKTPRTLALGEHSCFNSAKKSKGELLCKRIIEEIYGVPFYCVRPNFLKNPETNRNLELDLYNDDLKIAVEYNGIGHYVYPNPFHRTKEDFLNQVRRDQFKIETCDQNGVYLISVPYNVPVEYEKIKAYIEYHIPENYEKRKVEA